MTSFTVVLPLRITPNLDYHGMLGSYLDDPDNDAVFGSAECQDDLQRLTDLRSTIVQAISTKDSYDGGLEVMTQCYEYYTLLVQCESKCFPTIDPELLQKQTKQQNQSELTHNTSIQLEWESAVSSIVEVHSNLTMERLSIMWNLVTLEAYQASKQRLDSKVGWSKAAQHFQNAAVLVKHMLKIIQSAIQPLPPRPGGPPNTSIDFAPEFLELWQSVLVAESQRCVYQSLACAPRPRHLLLAKLAAAAVPLFNSCESLAQEETLNKDAPDLASNWADFVRAWSIFMSAKAEHHQACIHRDKHQWGLELARLDLAYRFANFCSEFCDSAPLPALQPLRETIVETLKGLKERIDEAETENKETHHEAVPQRNDLTEIRGERLVKLEQPLEKIIKPPPNLQPLFANLASPNLRLYSDAFRKDMDKLVFQMASIAEERTESARKALATVNLPHSLTAYRQEQSGGGIPDDLWERVQEIQRERRIAKLKQDLWGLRDVAEAARTTYQKVESQLEIDLESDRLFRQGNPGFEGHDAMEVQKTFRQSLENYDRLLKTAQEGDSVLLRRLEILDTNPKYKLLQFQKSQLDRLLPSAAGVGQNNTAGQAIDTSHLSRLLVELSALFHEREVLLETIKEDVKAYDIRGTLAQVDPRSETADQDYRDTLAFAQKSFDGIVFEMQTNIEKQTELVKFILDENERFMQAREMSQSSNSTSDSCIVMIEDAIEEIEQLSKHLKEGKDFYDVVIPKLEKLKHQVGDVSARLTVERLEYDDKANRNRQEEEDARLAQNMSQGQPGSGGARPGNGGPGGPQSRSGEGAAGGAAQQPGFARNSSQQPGFAQVTHDQPQITVDDEKVAHLVAMEFDPAKVVAALRKYDNNMDQALNDLLSC